jgi:hypothetical protein
VNRALHRRIERLELRVAPPDWQPLRVVCKLVSSDYELAPGERIVQDDVLEGESQRYPLMLSVHQRITNHPNDQGILWPSRRISIGSR